jgi:hypothetical protein
MPQAFSQFSHWALDFLISPPLLYVSLAILACLTAAIVVTLRSEHARARPRNLYLLPLVLLVAPLLAIAIGSKYWINPVASPSVAGTRLLNALDLLTFLSAIFFVYRAEGVRWLTAAVVVAELWLYISVSFFVAMAVTGDWL